MPALGRVVATFGSPFVGLVAWTEEGTPARDLDDSYLANQGSGFRPWDEHAKDVS